MKVILNNGMGVLHNVGLSIRLKYIPILLIIFILIVGGIGTYQGRWKEPGTNPILLKNEVSPKDILQLQEKNRALDRKLKSKFTQQPVIIVDTANNQLQLVFKEQVLLRSVVSSGSGNILNDPEGKKHWIFDTPRGEFRVNSKLRFPAWRRPDWDFIEKGEKIPNNVSERIQLGALGDYALGFGDGYFIHGTLYTRLLGRNVTHGCIRVGEKDLKEIYEKVSIGTYVYIY